LQTNHQVKGPKIERGIDGVIQDIFTA